ncbi:MAG: DUF502 domain-containing protein [Flavitalea sp.]
MKSRFNFRKLVQYFLQGLIILAPIAITIYAVTGLFNWIDRFLPDLVAQFFPNVLDLDANGKPESFPGLGFLLAVVMLILVGFISSSFIVGRLVDLLDKVLEHTPGIRIIYSPLKDFFEAFAGNKRKFDKVVLVQVVSDHVWEIGFITQHDLSQFKLQDHVAVYVPNSYAIAGRLYLVSKDKVKILDGISPTDAMKFTVTGGVTHME